MKKYPWQNLTRRQSLELLGMFTAATAFPSKLFAKEPTFEKGAIIRTILKDYAPADLNGPILFHEHIQRRKVGPDGTPVPAAKKAPAAAPADGAAAPEQSKASGAAAKAEADMSMESQNNPDLMAIEVAKVKDSGVACLVDGGHPDMGRDSSFIREVSQKSGVPIVTSGGYYLSNNYPKNIDKMSDDDIVQELIKQCDNDTIGAWGEIGSSDKMSEVEKRMFSAIGKAHLMTNLGIFTHNSTKGPATDTVGQGGLRQLDVFEKAGVKPNRIVIGHMSSLTDPNVKVHKELCKRGAFIGFDRQGANSGDDIVAMFMAILEAGYADNLMIAGDTTGTNYDRAWTGFVPKLKAAGVSDEVIHGIMVDNPRRFLAFVPKRPRNTVIRAFKPA